MPIIFVFIARPRDQFQNEKRIYENDTKKKNIQLTHEPLFGKEEATGLLLFI